MLARLRRLRADEGFTLIELLIVIIILGILAAIVVFAVGGITNRGYASACKSDYKSVEVAQEAEFAQSTATPPTYAASVPALVPAFLKDQPGNTTKYTIFTDSTGHVFSYAPGGTATPGTNDNENYCNTL